MDGQYGWYVGMMVQCVPEAVFDLAPLPAGAPELVCKLCVDASGLWCASWLDGIHKEVLRAAREGRRSGEPGVDYGHKCICYDSPADDPRGIEDSDLEELRTLLQGEPTPVPTWLSTESVVADALWWVVSIPEPHRRELLACKVCGQESRRGNGDFATFRLAFAWAHRGCAKEKSK